MLVSALASRATHAVPPPPRPIGREHEIHPKLRVSSHPVFAYSSGPTLRKYLGSAGDLWRQLQRRARRQPHGIVRTSVKELAGSRGKTRTVEWGLKRLADAHVIVRRRTQYGLEVRVLAYDTLEDGTPDFSPCLDHKTRVWMNDRRAAGRPKKPKAPEPAKVVPMPNTQPKQPASPPEPLPAAAVFVMPTIPPGGVPGYVLEATRRKLAGHPLVPPPPTKSMRAPRLPPPALLDPNARLSDQREFLIEAYVTTVKHYWPRTPVKRICDALRKRHNQRLLAMAVEVFLEEKIAPNAWLMVQCEHHLKRKTPPRAELVFDPVYIKRGAGRFTELAGEHAIYAAGPVKIPEYELYVNGARTLESLTDRTIKLLSQLPSLDDELSVARVCAKLWPDGYTSTYEACEQKMIEIRAELESRAARGTFLWG